MDFGVLIEIIRGAGAVIAIGDEQPVTLPHQYDRYERSPFYDLPKFIADILVRFGQKLHFGGAEDILRFKFLDIFPPLRKLADRRINILRLEDKREVLFCCRNVLIRRGGFPFYFLHDVMGLSDGCVRLTHVLNNSIPRHPPCSTGFNPWIFAPG
jgi:hypothetical protein